MTTVEKLLVQIFERKNSVIEQVRQQTELYSHHLASKLLIDGITPPPWLWDASASLNSKELNKEELISKLLHPHPRPRSSVHCSFTSHPFGSNLATTGDNEAFSERVFMENMAFNKGYHRQDGLILPEFSGEDHTGCAIDIVPEPDASVTSPEDHENERILNNSTVVELSLSRIRRSRSRQKAIELRNSPNSKAKSCSSHDNISKSLSNQIQFSLSSTDLVAQNDVVEKLAESPVFGSQSCKSLDREADLVSKEKETGLHSGRITRCRSDLLGPVVRDSLTLECFSEDCKNSASCYDEVAKLAKSFAVGSQSCRSSDGEADPLIKEKEMELCYGRITRSRSHSGGPVARDSLTLGCSSEYCKHEVSKLAESHVASQSYKNLDGEADLLSKEKEMDIYTGRITRSMNHSEGTVVRNSLTVGCSFEDCKDSASCHNEVAKLAESQVANQSRNSLDGEAELLSKEKEVDLCFGLVTRSRSHSEGSGVRDSLTLGCSSEDCKGGVSFHVAKVRERGSMSISDFEYVANNVKKLAMSDEPSAVCSRSCGNQKASTSDWINKDKETETGRMTGSKISVKCQSCACDSSTAGNSFDDYQRLSASIADSGVYDLPPVNGDGPLVGISYSDVCSEGCEGQEPIFEDRENYRGRSTSPSLSSSKLNSVDDVSHPEIPCNSMKADDDTPTSSRKPSHLFNYSSELLGLVKPSVGPFHRVTRSQTCSNEQEAPGPSDYRQNPCLRGINTMPKSDRTLKSANSELHTVNRSSPLRETHVMYGKHDIARFSIPSNVKESIQLESLTVPTPSGSFEVVESLQPTFIGNEEPKLKVSASSSQKRRLANSEEKTSYPLSDPATFFDKGISGDVDWHSISKRSMSKSDCKQKSTNVQLQIVSRSPSLHETHEMLGENEIAHFLIPSDTKERRQPESYVVPTPSGPLDSVKPMQPNYIEKEEYNLEASVSRPQKRRVTNSAEKMSSSLSDPAMCIEKGVSADVIQLSMGKESQGMPDVSDKLEEAELDSFESDSHENPSIVANEFGCAAVVGHYTLVRTSEDNTESELNYKISKAHLEADIITVDIPNMQTHPSKLQMEHGVESFPKQHNEEGNEGGGGIDNGRLISNSPESENLGTSLLQNSAKEPRVDSCGNILRKIQMKNSNCVLDKIENFPAQESQNSLCPENEVWDQQVGCSTVGYPPGEHSLLERRCVHDGIESSSPELKKRKVEHLQTHSSTAPSIPQARMSWSSQRSPASKYAKNLKINGDTIMLDTSEVVNRTDVDTFQNTGSNSTKGIEPTFSSHNAEEKNVEHNYSSVMNTEQLGAVLVPKLAKEEASSQGCFVERMSTLHSSSNDAGEAGDGQCNHQEKNFNDLRSETLTLANTMLDEMQSPQWEGDPQMQPFVFSPSTDDLNLVDVDQSMPMFEGFTVNDEADSGEVEFEANGINFDKMELPRNAIERASILAEICKSASLNTPLAHFSSSFELQGTQDLFQYVSDDPYEHLNMPGTLPLSSDVEEQLQSASVLADDCKEALVTMPYSDFQAYSGVLYDWNSRNHNGSPVGKMWGELSSRRGSSEKSSSSNPDLVCFPIEEDPCGSEENKSAYDHADGVQEKRDPSSADHNDKRQPLRDLTNLHLNPPTLVSAQEEMLKTDSVDFMSKKMSVPGAQDKIQLINKNQYRDGSQIAENDMSYVGCTDGRVSQTLSVGTNATRKTKESINSISKPSVSNKASLKRQDQKLFLKEARRNNIVSNVSSFIPMVQQKKVSSICTGKRDVKVKALEAAEAAKRLEEKIANERKMRKEALKVERAKLEERNLRNMKLEKKRKEEERKKREADNMAKKRMREEEVKKEKEKKRMKLEIRQRQREQEQKIHTEKVEKETQPSKDDRVISKKEFHKEYKNQLNMETSKGDDTVLEKTEIKWTLTDAAVNYEECSTPGQPCEAEKKKNTEDKSPKKDLIVQDSQEKSYEISPYQCSDDEGEEEDDDDDDELPTKKYIPSWASKNLVAVLLPLQQDMDPDAVFPPASFCSIDEVLISRKTH